VVREEVVDGLEKVLEELVLVVLVVWSSQEPRSYSTIPGAEQAIHSFMKSAVTPNLSLPHTR
jgi:hypothetical protein